MSLLLMFNPANATRLDPALLAIATSLAKLLGSAPRGRDQAADGNYHGHSRALTNRDLYAHLVGDRTIAIDVVVDGKAWFLAFDIDARFKQRLPLIGVELRRLGFESAAICTSGSDAGRGKILLFFDRPRSANGLGILARKILDAVRVPGSAWGPEGRSDVSVFPCGGIGGQLRIGGRNRHPSRGAQASDVFFSLDGEPRTFADVVPRGRICLKHDAVPIARTPIGKWVGPLRSTGVTYAAGGSNAIFRMLCRLAFEAMRVFGPELGQLEFEQWCADIWAASPDQRGPSPSGDKRAERTWSRRCENAWAAALKRETLSLPGGLTRQCFPSSRVLAVLRRYAAAKGMSPEAFAVSYRQIATHAGFGSSRTAFKHVQKLVKSGLVVVHDRGTCGPKGLPVLLGLVGDGETPEEILRRGGRRQNVKERRRVIAAYEVRRTARKPQAVAA